MASGELNPLFKKVLNAAENAFKHLHSKGSYKPEDITEKPYQKLIDETYRVFDSTIKDNDIPEEMLRALQSDAFLFGGLKTHAQLMEASTMLLEDGKVKSFNQFERDFQKINTDYNQNYLEAEYQFAVNSSQMAANWTQLDDSGRYYLQYRTAMDNRVRDEHAQLHDTTLPKEDDFWLSYYPPNGWRCRCQAVEVRKSKYEESDSATAIEKGEKATTQIGKDGKNRLEIFRFNPGKEEKIFPPKHPYNKLKGADVAKEALVKLETENDYEILNKSEDFTNIKEYLKERVKNAYPNIDIDKINSVYLYSGEHFEEINAFNRGTLTEFKPDKGLTKEFYQSITRTIKKTLDEIPDKYSGTVYRGVLLEKKYIEPYKKAFETGDAHTELGFLSTSYEKAEAFRGNVKFEIKSKSGTVIEKIAKVMSEKEVLFKAGQQFKVTGFVENEDNRFIIQMEEL